MLLIRFSTTSLEPSQGLRLFINGTNSSRSVRKRILRVSLSWLAKARMRGDGPPFIKLGEKSIRYSEAALLQWMKGRQRLSTSEQ
jgi:predicted DNA-binding transcriptional regulator AlpA